MNALGASNIQDALLLLSSNAFQFAVTMLLQSTLILFAGLLLIHLVRKRGGAAQSLAFRATLVGMLLCPLVSVALTLLGVDHLAFRLPGPTFPGESPSAFAATSDATQVHPSQNAQPAAVVESPLKERFLSTLNSPRTSAFLCAVWGVVALILLARVARAYVQTVGLRLAGKPTTEAVQKLCDDLAEAMRMPAPKVVWDPSAKSPCLLGFAHPVVLLPESELKSHPERLRNVLIHELAHLWQRDCLWNLLGRLVQSVFFFQPLLHPFLRRMEETCDNVADDFVVLWGNNGPDYASHLMEIAQRGLKYRMPLAAAGVSVFNSSLGRRVARILDLTRPVAVKVSRGTATLIVLFFTAFVLSVGALCGCQSVDARTAKLTPISAPKPAEPAQQPAQPPEQLTRVLPPAEAPTFVDDPSMIGKWKSVDFVATPDDFTPEKQGFKGDLYWKGVEIMQQGRTSGPWQWTRGALYHPGDQTLARCFVREQKGVRYLFVEWMSGDVVYRGRAPKYYVLRYVGESKAEALPQGPINPNDYRSDAPPAFVDDPNIIGTWQAVDFVGAPTDFEPGAKKWTADLFLRNMEFAPGGALKTTTEKGTYDGNQWSNGVVWSPNDRTISRYYIRDIDNDRYLFFEWISGDVIFRAQRPHYYVLKLARP